VNRLVWGDWVPGRGPDDAAVSTTPLSRSTITSRLAGVLSEYGSADTASDARLLRELSNAVERLVAEGAVAEPV
jgi:putative N-acetylmannosamine-6-phosphate epimerase